MTDAISLYQQAAQRVVKAFDYKPYPSGFGSKASLTYYPTGILLEIQQEDLDEDDSKNIEFSVLIRFEYF